MPSYTGSVPRGSARRPPLALPTTVHEEDQEDDVRVRACISWSVVVVLVTTGVAVGIWAALV